MDALDRPAPTARRLAGASISLEHLPGVTSGALHRLDAWLDGRPLEVAILAAVPRRAPRPGASDRGAGGSRAVLQDRGVLQDPLRHPSERIAAGAKRGRSGRRTSPPFSPPATRRASLWNRPRTSSSVRRGTARPPRGRPPSARTPRAYAPGPIPGPIPGGAPPRLSRRTSRPWPGPGQGPRPRWPRRAYGGPASPASAVWPGETDGPGPRRVTGGTARDSGRGPAQPVPGRRTRLRRADVDDVTDVDGVLVTASVAERRTRRAT